MVLNTPGVFTYSLAPNGATACLVRNYLYVGTFINGTLNPADFQQLTTDGSGFHCTWSPAGDWIAFDTDLKDPRGARAVWKIRPDGSEMTDLSVHGQGEWVEPSWDPTGTKLVYVRYVNGTPFSELFVMDSDGANSTRLTRNDVMDISPRFSPDGMQICYVRYGEGLGPEVCIINANGSQHRILAAGQHPVWSPDGSEIAYVAASKDPSTNGTVWIINANGSTRTQLTRSRI